MNAIGNAFSAVHDRDDQEQTDINEAIDTIDRIMTMDRLAPNYHNVVSDAGLKVSYLVVAASESRLKSNSCWLVIGPTIRACSLAILGEWLAYSR